MKFSIVAVNVENLPPDVVGIEGENCRGEGVLLIRIRRQPAVGKSAVLRHGYLREWFLPPRRQTEVAFPATARGVTAATLNCR